MSKIRPINPINRIVIGDVGSGKTIVAFLIALTYLRHLENGTAVLMAPTEILAKQHYDALLNTFFVDSEINEHFEILFTAGKQRWINENSVSPAYFKKYSFEKTLKKRIFIGTQALLFQLDFTPDLVLVDEQHRFGVFQREKLTKQDETDKSSHFISFSATPIPRSLALTAYGQLKPHFLSRIGDRKPIETKIYTFDELQSTVINYIDLHLQKHDKIYILCPLVTDSDKENQQDLWSVEKAYEYFSKHFKDQLLYVHGKQKEKQNILNEFKNSKDKNILIATSVIEVGVDVPEATLIIILNSERFGLAALHQLRGRIGRNNLDRNLCLLITEKGKTYTQRLQALVKTNDGLELAQKDLELRGSGQMVGSLQSGLDPEIGNIMSISSQNLENIKQVVDSLDFQNLNKSLPRLNSFLQKKASQYWQE